MRRRWPPECSVSDSLFSSVSGRREDTHVRKPMECPLLAHSSLARGSHPAYLIGDPGSRAAGVGSCPRNLVGMTSDATILVLRRGPSPPQNAMGGPDRVGCLYLLAQPAFFGFAGATVEIDQLLFPGEQLLSDECGSD